MNLQKDSFSYSSLGAKECNGEVWTVNIINSDTAAIDLVEEEMRGIQPVAFNPLASEAIYLNVVMQISQFTAFYEITNVSEDRYKRCTTVCVPDYLV